ncbi:MAG TPA: alpha/beta fold hydrolase [Actinomycetota bacterium]|jgi:pimeloyl-ACP methyl ester carboxylesterase|nr:alpha/beta fold hydrolase [Actinomycetota bacterium]
MGTSRAAMWTTWAATQVTGRIAPRLAGGPVERLWFTPWPVPVTGRERERRKAWLAGTDPLDLRLDGVRVAGFTAGAGPSVLLVHGWGEEGASLGAAIAPLTAAGFRVVGFDFPSHGASGPGETNLYSFAQVVREIAARVEARAIVAHSMGAATTILALTDGLKPEAVALLAPAVRVENALDPFARLLRIPPGAMKALRDRIERRFGSDVWHRTRGDVQATSFDIPALIVHDRDDPQIQVADAELLAGGWRGAELFVTEGLGHMKIAREPEVLDRVTGFLASRLALADRPA